MISWRLTVNKRCCSVGEQVAECWPLELSGLEDNQTTLIAKPWVLREG